MADFHHNIFYYYGGRHQSDNEREQQLEDNTTKALINTLEHCDPTCDPTVVVKFLKWLDIETTGPAKFVLQKPSIGKGRIHGKPQRLLLGLVPPQRGTAAPAGLNQPAKQTEDSRPDAWIYGDNFVVLIESKVKGPLTQDQMRRHWEKLQSDTQDQPRCEVRNWAEVHRFFVKVIDELPKLSGQDKWLIKQFTQYLEWRDMAEFTGLEQGIFGFFVTHDDEDTRRWVRDTVQAFAAEVSAQLQAFDPLFYQGYDPGRLQIKDEQCWVAFGPEHKEYRQWAHQTVSLNALGVEVFVNVELKAAMDRLKERIFPDDRQFREIVSGMPGPFFVQLEERKQKQGPLYGSDIIAKLQGGYRKSPDSEPYGLKNPQSDGFDYIKRFLDQVHLPCLSVRRHMARETACKQGRSLVDEVVGIMKEFHPLVDFINEPDYTKRH